MTAKKRTWRVYEELPDGTEVNIETGLTEERAADIVGDLCADWENEHLPEEDMSDEEYDKWREENDPPFWSEEEGQ